MTFSFDFLDDFDFFFSSCLGGDLALLRLWFRRARDDSTFCSSSELELLCLDFDYSDLELESSRSLELSSRLFDLPFDFFGGGAFDLVLLDVFLVGLVLLIFENY